MARVTGPSPLFVLAALALGGCFDAGEPIVGASNGVVTTTTTDETTTSTTTGTTTTGTTTDATTTTTTGDPEEPDAYRVTKISVVDPHVYFALTEGGECADVTKILNAWLANEVNGGDVSQAIVLYPASADDGVQAPLRVVNAQCNGALDTCSELSDSGDVPLMSVATNKGAGTCSVVLSGTWNPLYSEEGVPNVATAPCFSSGSSNGTIRLASGENLPALALEDVRLSGTYAVTESGKVTSILKGTIRGYLRESEAKMVAGMIDGVSAPFNFWGSIAGGGGCQVDVNNPIDDTDPYPVRGDMEAGAWLYLNFEATQVEWFQ